MTASAPSKQSTLVERLRDNAQGINLGAEGMGWGPADLYAAAADEIERLTAALAACQTHDYRQIIEESERLREGISSMRVFIQDCIETGHDRGQLGNLYACRDIIDRCSSGETFSPQKDVGR